MFYIKYFFYLLLLQWIDTTAQVNLYFTDLIGDIGSNEALQHHCLYTNGKDGVYFEVEYSSPIAYCISEPATNFDIQKNDIFPSFTFAELSKQNVTSEQLYLWSASIDLIEHYQYYLNQLSTTNDASLSKNVFYNCTWPRFGPQCEYEFDHDHRYAVYSLSELLLFYQWRGTWDKTDWTCYIHLPCNRSIGMKCLDWTDICDGKIDCLNDGIDEEHCWKLEINVCGNNEYQVHKNILGGERSIEQGGMFISSNCIHLHSHYKNGPIISIYCASNTFDVDCDEMVCIDTFLTSSCLKGHPDLLETLYSIKENSTSNDCWTAFKCLLKIPNTICHTIDRFKLMSTIEITCQDITFIPAVPILFGDIYIAYVKNKSRDSANETYLYFHLCSNNFLYSDYFTNSSKIVFNNTICYQSIRWQFKSSLQDLYKLFQYRYGALHRYNRFSNYSSELCSKSNMYQCINSSKCISIHRLMDDIYDCPSLDDENANTIKNITLTKYYNNSHYKCRVSDKYIPIAWLRNGRCDCSTDKITACEDERLLQLEMFSTNKFSIICNGKIDLLPIVIDGRNETDETECEHWPCINYYTRCNNQRNCINGDDEEFCDEDQLIENQILKHKPIHSAKSIFDSSPIQSKPLKITKYQLSSYFSSPNPSLSNVVSRDFVFNLASKSNLVFSNIAEQSSARCHRGINLRVWLASGSNSSRLTCLCPPSYYGDVCQYQNQRVNLYLAFEVLFESNRIILVAVASLIDDDNERIIHSYQQFTLVNKIDCAYNYFMTLTYSIRPKDKTKRYSIHIDIYEKISLGYRGSFLLPLIFPFLPVHRLLQILVIPPHNDSVIGCLNRQCNHHGRCIRYLNHSESAIFCQCYRGWSGKYCHIQHHCTCSSDSLCIGVSTHNRSVCVCPINRLGLRCLIADRTCHTNGNLTCRNQAQCISHVDLSGLGDNFRCICRKGFHGRFCEIPDHKIALSFGKDIVIPYSMYIHFFTMEQNDEINRKTISRTISTKQNSTIIYWEHSFTLILIQFIKTNNSYLVAMHLNNTESQNITKMINSSDQCLHISELVNQTIYNLHVLRRIKYYHLICQTYSSNLSCFYDDSQICVCDNYGQQRHPYCFNSTGISSFLCQRHSNCYNGGQCFEDNWFCPSSIWCVCPSCFYGRQCQFSTSGFGLSLDSILSYRIQPHIKIIHQSSMVLVTAALSIIFLIIGFINSLFSLITFKNKNVRQVGCGIYLLSSSIITLLITIIFGLKVWILILIQMLLIENRLFLTIQCRSIDFLLRSCLSMDQWLNACVATERAVCAIQEIRFNKRKSKKIAKLVIILLITLNIATSIHDPIYRKVIYEKNYDDDDVDIDDSRRSWCIILYPSSHLSTYNHVMHTFHFFAPFLLNLISFIILVIKKSYHQMNIRRDLTFKTILRDQFQQHKHLFIAPIGSIILSIPRLIIAYATKCMESENDGWLYLIAYFISFIPPMLTFIIFIRPSKVFKKEFQKTVRQYRSNLRNLLNLNS